jgi:hypothetical protein
MRFPPSFLAARRTARESSERRADTAFVHCLGKSRLGQQGRALHEKQPHAAEAMPEALERLAQESRTDCQW